MVSLVGDGGTLDKLLQARKDFDSYIQNSFPTLYNSDRLSPIKKAVLDIRGAVNDVIESRLPDGILPNGTTFKQSLRTQKVLYDAVDNAASKIKIGEATTAIGKAGTYVTNAVKTAGVLELGRKAITGNW